MGKYMDNVHNWGFWQCRFFLTDWELLTLIVAGFYYRRRRGTFPTNINILYFTLIKELLRFVHCLVTGKILNAPHGK